MTGRKGIQRMPVLKPAISMQSNAEVVTTIILRFTLPWPKSSAFCDFGKKIARPTWIAGRQVNRSRYVIAASWMSRHFCFVAGLSVYAVRTAEVMTIASAPPIPT